MTEIKIGRGAANRITVSFPYNPDRIAKIKSIRATDGIQRRKTGAYHRIVVIWIGLHLYLRARGLISILLSKP